MSSYCELINHLSNSYEAPIKISDIAEWFKDNGFQDTIKIYPVDVDYDIASAWIVRRKEHGVPYAEAKKITSIYYSKHHNECWARFLVCKELMHFFDHENNAAANDKAKINVLIGELIDWNSFDKSAEANTTKADIMARSRALLCLAPAHIIDNLIEKDALSKKTLKEIAYFFKIPSVMVEKAFSDKYLETHSSVKHDQDLVAVK